MTGSLCIPDIPAAASEGVAIRMGTERDVESLCGHFLGLSRNARYNRFMGATGDLSGIARDCLAPERKAGRFALVAECRLEGRDVIVGEASYAFDPKSGCGEFALSVADEFQRRGVGSRMLATLQYRAVSLGYLDLFGEALKSNDQMKRFALKAGFEFTRSLDWRAVRFDKRLKE